MNKNNSNFLVADSKILAFHEKIQDFATLVNQKIYETNAVQDPNPTPTADDALLRISADIFALHRSILSLCIDGWSLAAPIILRTMLELHLSILIITKSTDNCEYFGFKYMYGFHKKLLSYKGSTEDRKKESRKMIDDGLNRLDNSIRQKAKDSIFKQPLGSYWYCPEYKNPNDILDKLNNETVREDYELFSSASHGGILGLSLLKGQPDDIHPNPRSDNFSQNLVLSYSSRIMIESFYARGTFEGINLEQEFIPLWEEFKKLKIITEKSSNNST